MKYELAVFDMDGTVLDTLDDLTDSVNYALFQNGLPQRTKAQVKAFVGNGIGNLVKRAVGENVGDTTLQSTLCDFKAHYAVHCADKTKPYDGIYDVLTALRNAGIKTALVSNKSDSGVQALIQKYFPGYFDFAVGEKAGIQRKPAPDEVFSAVNALDTKKEKAVFIGDSEVDVLTAHNAGMDCISVLWGFREKDFLLSKGATVFAHKPSELTELICDI